MPAVGMSRQYAHRFMQIGENLNVHDCGHLPKAVATLYELSRRLRCAKFAHLPASPTALLALSRMGPDDVEDSDLKSWQLGSSGCRVRERSLLAGSR